MSLPLIPYVKCWCLLWCLLSAFRFPFACLVQQWELSCLGLQCCNPMEYTLSRHMHLLVMICGPCEECTGWFLLPLLQVGGASCYSFVCPPAIPSTWLGIQLSYMAGSGLLFQVVFHMMTQSTLNLWWMLNLVICVWWLSFSLMNLLTPGQQSASLLGNTFTLVSWGRCQV